MFALFALKGQKCRIHIDEVCTRRHLRPIFRGRPPARGAPRRRLPGRVPTRKKRLDNGSRMNRVAGGGAGRGHLAGLGMDEARSRPGRGWLVQQLSGEWFGLRPGRVLTINDLGEGLPLDELAWPWPADPGREQQRSRQPSPAGATANAGHAVKPYFPQEVPCKPSKANSPGCPPGRSPANPTSPARRSPTRWPLLCSPAGS
ncbi:MAG: hypothetical protein KC449_12220 [Anaerolineales bacterium]|nr:hypothetical protein [Anaerolineales bacterium]